MLSPRASAMDQLCSTIPGAITSEVRDQLVNARLVEVTNTSAIEELATINLLGEVDVQLDVVVEGVSHQSGGLLYQTVDVRQI